jgi:HAD superfamily hydrolase (TIGR01509 family)
VVAVLAVRDFDLVIFDCDGVVVDSEVIACQCLADVMTLHGVPIGLEEVFERFLGRSFAAVEAHCLRVTGRVLSDRFREDLRAHQLAAFTAELKAMPQVREVLATLAQPFCLASSSDAERIDVSLAAAGLGSAFGERIYNAAMVKRGKPAPDLFLHVAEQMGADARRTLVIEDSVTGVEAGKAAGMTVWGFTGGSHYAGRAMEPSLLAAGADRVFNAMAEFMAPASAGP